MAIDSIFEERVKKLDLLRSEQVDPYPIISKRSLLIESFLGSFSSLARKKQTVYLAGRVRSIRDQGKILFVSCQDSTGKVQCILKKDILSDFTRIKKTLDMGDIIQVSGTALISNTGEKSLLVKKYILLSKSLRPLPSDFYGLEDVETRLRKRYLDTLLNTNEYTLFIKKAIFWKSMRDFLETAGFMAVETPVFEVTPGGAEAEPFVTHHNALDEDFYLRISLEIALKKMIVGGFEKIYEIGRIFRNEGIDAEHLQDYTQLEFYWAYADYRELMKFVKKMYQSVIKKTFGTLVLPFGNKKINWGGAWKTVDYCVVFKKYNKLDVLSCSDDDLKNRAKELGISFEKGIGRGRLIDLIYKKTVRPLLIQPTFLINPPVTIEPLAKRSQKDPRVVERFQVMAYGTELGKGFSELNDPIDQRKRFEEQMKLREKGDKEAQMLDEEFLEALEYGMPPTAGFGTSERLFAVLAQRPIRETIFSPPMKKKD
ncbi:MAG: lysine--tRNA ligase [Patescibacteria group bacterium]|nr:lysine--tRNA ligase [Patescibacteria group bacterium]